MKNILIEKSLILIGVLSSFFAVIKKDSLQITSFNKQLVDSDTLIKKSSLIPQDTIDIDSILIEAKETVKAYNKSIEDKNKMNKRLLFLTKKEVANAKETSDLIKNLIAKYKLNKYNADDKLTISDLKVDSTCINEYKYLFGKKRCIE